MGICVVQLIEISPYLYHVTYEDSLRRIRKLQRLESAAALMEAGGKRNCLRAPCRFKAVLEAVLGAVLGGGPRAG